MRRKLIIFSTLCLVLFSLAYFGYTVYASLNQTFSVANKIGFIPSGKIFVSIQCSVTGCVQSNFENPPTGYASMEEYWEAIGVTHSLEFDESMRDADFQDIESDDVAWKIKESLKFKDTATPIVYTVRVYNYSNLPIRVHVTDYVESSDYFINEASTSVRIEGYVYGEDPDFAEVTLKTYLKDNQKGAGFSGEQNNFNIKLITVEA